MCGLFLRWVSIYNLNAVFGTVGIRTDKARLPCSPILSPAPLLREDARVAVDKGGVSALMPRASRVPALQPGQATPLPSTWLWRRSCTCPLG